jgi:hypothetical protein
LFSLVLINIFYEGGKRYSVPRPNIVYIGIANRLSNLSL